MDKPGTSSSAVNQCDGCARHLRKNDSGHHVNAYGLPEMFCTADRYAPSGAGAVSVPRSLAERTEAMFRSVDPEGGIAQEWKLALAATEDRATDSPMNAGRT